jgi:hypothetical protein
MLLMLLCFVEANKLCNVDNNTNSSSCNKVYFDPEIDDIWVLAFFERFSQFFKRYWGEIWSVGRCCGVCSCQFVRFWWGLCLYSSVSVAFSGRVRGFGFETVSLRCGHFPRCIFLEFIDCLLLPKRFVALGRSGYTISAFFGKLRVEVNHWDWFE